MLNAVPGEDLELSFFHRHRDGNDERPFRGPKVLVHPWVQPEGLRGVVELQQRGFLELVPGMRGGRHSERHANFFSCMIVGASGTYPSFLLMPRIAAFCSSLVVPKSLIPSARSACKARSF